MLTDRVAKYCGIQRGTSMSSSRDRGHRSLAHQDEEPADHGICERFHKDRAQEFYRARSAKRFTVPLPSCRPDLDVWVREYNETPMQRSLTQCRDEGENDAPPNNLRKPKPDRLTRHRLSDRVSANTPIHSRSGSDAAMPTIGRIPPTIAPLMQPPPRIGLTGEHDSSNSG